MIAPARIAAYEILSAVSAGNADLPTAIALARASLNDERDRALSYFSTTLSHPRWLAARWYDRLGFEAAERWLMFNNEAAPVTLRANRLRVTARELADRLAGDDVRVTPARFATDALLVEDGHPLRGRGLDEGWFVVQDEASQLVAALADAGSHARVLDACASPGGKATAMAAAMNGRGLLVACDVRGRRMELLRKTVAASGATNVRLVQADLLVPLAVVDSRGHLRTEPHTHGLEAFFGAVVVRSGIRWR